MNVFQYIKIDIVIAKWRLKYWSQNVFFSDCNSIDLNGNGYCRMDILIFKLIQNL